MADQELLQAIGTMMDQKIAPIHQEIQALKTEVQDLKADVQGLKTEVREIKVTQEGVVLPRIQLLAEGHENILEHIQEKIDAKTDKLQNQIDVLTIVVKYHTKEIQRLKRAR